MHGFVYLHERPRRGKRKKRKGAISAVDVTINAIAGICAVLQHDLSYIYLGEWRIENVKRMELRILDSLKVHARYFWVAVFAK